MNKQGLLTLAIVSITGALLFFVFFWTLIGLSSDANADELTVYGGLGYADASLVTSHDWSDNPTGLVGLRYTKEISDRWNLNGEAMHASTALDGPPFNNTPESDFNFIGITLEYKIWSN